MIEESFALSGLGAIAGAFMWGILFYVVEVLPRANPATSLLICVGAGAIFGVLLQQVRDIL